MRILLLNSVQVVLQSLKTAVAYTASIKENSRVTSQVSKSFNSIFAVRVI